MALVMSEIRRIIYFTSVIFLVVTIMSSSCPTCQAGNSCSKFGHRCSPPPPSETCYTEPSCDPLRCYRKCQSLHKEYSRCKSINVNPHECCCNN
ncbi:hypothetical protein BDA96_05G163300 [Sorghum bicolor]|uniref:Uncharacterized protein n=2 Tax=Sorghum bicolor TaxID=4558 RepID=A0A921R0H7_SORBI|nr:hypothetical protein BDA96_05G163300 [Sorghum bicolor]KXG28664.1 hypothetical protein SORBI_3005G150000 [Sorghum bicolor]